MSMALGLGMGLPLTRASSGLEAALRAALFGAGEQGAWYDPSDLSTMYQDSSGTTAAAVGQPVGLVLDKRLGLVRGVEVVANGSFDSGADWTSTAGITIADGVATFATPDATGTLMNTGVVVAGSTYEATFTVSGFVSGGISIGQGPSSVSAGVVASANGTFRQIFTATVSGVIGLRARLGATSLVADNFSVRELPGNHATQATTALKPILSARKNLFLYSQDMGNGYWGKTRMTVTPNASTAPDGTTTADLLDTNATGGGAAALFNAGGLISTSAGAKYTYAHRFKAGTVGWVVFNVGNSANTNYARRWFNLNTGALGSAGTVGAGLSQSGAAITALGGGWYQCQLTVTADDSALRGGFSVVNADAVFASTIGDNVFAWGAQLEPGTTATRYQRVTTSTDYDSAGFPHYLEFDGVDDGMVTASINFTATDKMTVFAGVRKLSNTPSVVAEFSVTTTANTGSFYLIVRDTNPREWSALARGGAAASLDQIGYDSTLAPDTAVITCLHNIAGDLSRLRRNGIVGTDGTGDKGAGNFGNYPLYIGRRGGTTLAFPGHIYSLIVRGALTDAAGITDGETFTATKTGVTI